MAFSVLLLLEHPEAFPCCPFLFTSIRQYVDGAGGYAHAHALARAKISSVCSVRRGSVQAAPVTPSVMLCPVQARDETLLSNPFTACSVKLVLVLVGAVAYLSPLPWLCRGSRVLIQSIFCPFKLNERLRAIQPSAGKLIPGK